MRLLIILLFSISVSSQGYRATTYSASKNGYVSGNTILPSYLNGVFMSRDSEEEPETPEGVNLLQYSTLSTGIVEGVVNNTVAANNTALIEVVFNDAKTNGYDGVEFDVFDAYFKTDNAPELPWTAAINVPSDFYLKMSNNTHLRQQPNTYRSTTLLAVSEVNNVIIDGGNLHGDRDTHDYDTEPGTSHEWGHCLRVASAKYVTIKNMTIMDAGGDAIDIQGTTHVTDPNHISAQYINILDNTLLRSRRNNMSITGGEDILIDGNLIKDAGIWTDGSNGVWPGWGIDVEAVVGTEIAERITISNNIEEGSNVGSFICFIGDYVTIENNQCETGISLLHTKYSIVRNNTLIATDEELDGNVIGITTSEKSVNSNSNNEIYGNTISGFRAGLSIGANDNVMHNNTVTDFSTGLLLDNSANCKVYGNSFASTQEDSKGLAMGNLAETIDNLIIGAELNESNDASSKNTFNVEGIPFRIEQFNTNSGDESLEVIVKNNDFISSSSANSNLFLTNGVTLKNNNIPSQLFLYSINDCLIDSNTIGSFRMGISDTNALLTNSTISNNTIASGCVVAPTDSLNLTITNNTCN